MAAINSSLLKKYLPKKKELKILDAGCGPGAALLYLSAFGDVVGIDISDVALKFAKKRGKVKKGTVTAIPFKDNSFDLVTCLDVLYHAWVEDNDKAISELYRVIKKDGIILIREPAFDWLHSSEDVVDFTKHRFTEKEVAGYLKKDFKILKLSYINFILFPLALLKRLPEILNLKEKENTSDIFTINPLLNFFLFAVFKVESFLIPFLNFPFGTSVICVAKKI